LGRILDVHPRKRKPLYFRSGQGFSASDSRYLSPVVGSWRFLVLLSLHVCARNESMVASFLEQCNSGHSIVCHSWDPWGDGELVLSCACNRSTSGVRNHSEPHAYPTTGLGFPRSSPSSQPRKDA